MSLKQKVVFLDKDGTIIPDVPYNVNPELISLKEGVTEGLQLLKQQGYVFIVISNQAGVARGFFQLSELEKVKEKITLLLGRASIEIEAYYFCPHHPEGKIAEFARKCECRKPAPGMILQAAEDLNIDLSKSWMVGDILNDVEAGNRAGCRTVLLNEGNETEWIEGSFRTPTYVAPGFLDAAKYIAQNSFANEQLNDKKLAAV